MKDLAPNLPQSVGVAVSYAADAATAVEEAVSQLDVDGTRFILVFVPDCLPLDDVGPALTQHLSATSVFGCTTAGQITPEGYENNALLMIAFPKEHFRCSSMLIHPLKPVSIEETATNARRLATQFQRTAEWNRLALIFADGLSKQEDVLVAALEAGLDDLPVFGGSAGNGLNFDETFVLHAGEFHTDAALLILMETDLMFAGIGFDHFLPTEKRMVVTRTVPDERLVLEINGAPAAAEYARLIGRDIEDLSPRVFAENPVLVRNNTTYHVRGIQQVAENQALSFLSAIDDGLLLTLGRGKEILRTLDQGLTMPEDFGEQPDFILGFDCFLRKLEIEQNQLVAPASEILRDRRVLGFNTYGEQHCGVHVNQTFVGVAFFRPKERKLF
ncbi:FIST N-terminal domain-containing protein [Actibacterium lipolyticum]|uniref:FIST N domain protein n=1 Tax=Actibacterium lipolyticum TaxID=1524263 RepID=A0A238JPI1_9RHOB|nr:FIST N-terminal domain-containing protein [Actibacterium lipolyticum]SMX32353.1 FIST N domain protein [Actibacterium lipolyticum]